MQAHDSETNNTNKQKATSELQAIQVALRDKTLAVSVGDGSITVVIDGFQQIRSIEIQKALLDGISEEELRWLQKILTIAINKAIQQSQSMAFEQFGMLAEYNLDSDNKTSSGA